MASVQSLKMINLLPLCKDQIGQNYSNSWVGGVEGETEREHKEALWGPGMFYCLICVVTFTKIHQVAHSGFLY